jgi:type III restriction enzyme
MKSHVSHVVLDSSWENMAAFHLEMSPHVLAWVKNDRLDFEIYYEYRGRVHKYLPDYLVRIDAGGGTVMYILEIKGLEDEKDRAKFTAARRWCSAVNYHGGFGRWIYVQSRKPGELRAELQKFHELARSAAGD